MIKLFDGAIGVASDLPLDDDDFSGIAHQSDRHDRVTET
jgi:hypothetical protein